MTESSVFLGALATHKLVGREAELAALEAAVRPASAGAFTCFVLEAKGGLGKTRLLREVYDRLTLTRGESLNPNKGVWCSERDTIIPLELIDLSEVALHALVGFLREVRQRFEIALPDDAQAAFKGFDDAWLSYQEARDGELDFNEVAKRTKQLEVSFAHDYATITKDRRVVWILDTLEQLFAVPREIEHLLTDINLERTDLGRTTYSWLLDFIQSRPFNTTLLLAGRPEPSRWASDLRTHLSADAGSVLTVSDFTIDEIDLYMTYLCAQLEQLPNLTQRAHDLRERTDEAHEIANLHHLTGGNPIRLALYVDLFFNADTLPSPFGDPTSTKVLSGAAISELRNHLDTELLEYLTSHLDDPEPQVLEYLSVMRRGLDKPGLKMLWNTEDDVAVDDVFERLRRLSFIKVRGDTLFLHDEFYSIYQRNLTRQSPAEQQAERERQHNIFTRLIDYSDQRALELVREIAQVRAELAALDKNDADYLPKKERYRKLRSERRRYRIQRVHYALYNDPKTGLNNLFFRVAGQAFMSNEPELDELLQSEVTIFFFGTDQELNRQQTGVSAEDWQLLRFHVLHERVSLWIRQLILKIQRDKAQSLARRAQVAHHGLVARLYPDLALLYAQPAGALVSELFLHEWSACRCFAAIYAGGDLHIPLAELTQLTDTFKDRLSHAELLRTTELTKFRWRIRNILAECFHFRGYAHASLYEFKLAEEVYKQANAIVEKTGFKTLQSDIKNNLARVYGERGNLYEALALCEEALAIRDENGFDLLRGLSRNTLALINTRNAHPMRALEHANSALAICRQLNNPRGIGLVLLQIAEIKRRLWNIRADEIRNDQIARSRIDRELLTEVTSVLDEAEQLFAEAFPSPVRLVEVLIEHGSLYRDWVIFFGLDDMRVEFAKAEEFYLRAMKLAKENSYPQHYLSACVNLAWLYAKSGELKKAEQMAEKSWNAVSEEYKFNTLKPVNSSATSVTNFRELGKLHALYSLKLLPKEALKERLRERMLATTATQLFSPYDSFYLSVNKRELASFVASNFRTAEEKHQLRVWIKEIVKDYHLAALKTTLKSLQAEEVLKEILEQQSDEPDYLKD